MQRSNVINAAQAKAKSKSKKQKQKAKSKMASKIAMQLSKEA